MSSYRILPYSYEQAKKLGVSIKPSENPKKKVDVFQRGKKIASIGAKGYTDFPHLKQTDSQEADKRRKAYKARHAGNRMKLGSAGFYASNILW